MSCCDRRQASYHSDVASGEAVTRFITWAAITLMTRRSTRGHKDLAHAAAAA